MVHSHAQQVLCNIMQPGTFWFCSSLLNARSLADQLFTRIIPHIDASTVPGDGICQRYGRRHAFLQGWMFLRSWLVQLPSSSETYKSSDEAITIHNVFESCACCKKSIRDTLCTNDLLLVKREVGY